jgi:antitoxin HigA-1
MFTRLDAATSPEDMNAPGWKLHALSGDLAGNWSVWVNGNWRRTFAFDGKTPSWSITRIITRRRNMGRMFSPAHPGEVLKAFLPPGLTVTEAAKRLGVSRVQLSRLLNGRAAMTADMALRVSLLTSTSPESWLNNQVQWDLWQASQKPLPKIDPLPKAA